MVAARSHRASYAPAWRPPPRMSLSEWADIYPATSSAGYVLSSKTSAEPGRWRTLPYQRGMMDAMADPFIRRVSIMKSARVGYTEMGLVLFAYHIAHDPCPIMIVQPTVEDAEGYSKEQLAEMLRTVPAVSGLVSEQGVKNSDQTVLLKSFPGGVLGMVGANSGRGFRRVLRRVIYLDEIDGYPPSAGTEGDPVKLAEKRGSTFWNRKIIAGSTPLIAGSSRIEELFEAGDRRRYHVPCPSCGHMDFLVFRPRSDGRGHVMTWPDDQPELACFECSGCHLPIEESSKRALLEAGEWRADGEFHGHASFHIWAAYSMSPNATWGQIAAEFLEAKRLGVEKLKTFINTTLGETWQERGEAPPWEGLFQRREQYQIGTVPAGVLVLTAGVDVQKDRLVYEVVGWAANKESWSIEAGELGGDTALLAGPGSPWVQLDELLGRSFPGADGRVFAIARMAVDGGWQTTDANTQTVYAWGRQHDRSRVMVTKGVRGARALVDAATPVDVAIGGKRIQRGYRVWPIGVDVAKGELYGWLRLVHVEGDPPPGYCHFPEHPAEFFRQLTAEHLMTHVHPKTRVKTLRWEELPNRENHALDARVLARVAAAAIGIDRLAAAAAQAAPPPPTTPVAPPIAPLPPVLAEAVAPAPRQDRPRSGGRWGGGGRFGARY